MKTNLKFNSTICTSREQSERLLALGLKKKTADMHHYKWSEGYWDIQACPARGFEPCYIPAWSLHRLMTLLMIGDKLGCITHNIHQNNISTYYELVIASIEHLIKIDEFNKEYLEE